ncbi:MAG: Hsp20/alpha crystallin family protein [Gaiellaceae bacterium]
MSLMLPDRRFELRQKRREPLDLDDVSERMRRMLEQTFAGIFPSDVEELWTPLVDLEEQDDAYTLEAELPGVKKEDVKIEYAGNELTISGEIKERERKGVLRRKVRRTGGFLYRVVLPQQVDAEHIEAKLQDGVLSIRAPKAEKAVRRKIEIKAS